MSARVYITGYGLITALGTGVEEHLIALEQGRTGIALPQFLNTVHRSALVTGEVKFSNQTLAEKAGANPKTSRTALLGLVAAKEAILSAGLDKKGLKKAAFINGTSVGGMDISEHHYEALTNKADLNYAAAFSGHDCGAGTAIIADHFGIKGQLSTISTACSSSANTIMQAGRLIRAGRFDTIIAGGSDALSLFTLNGFNALKILDPQLCKPFDDNRAGLNLGEGAAYLVLESEAQIAKRKAQVLGELVGYGNANDAYHQTASSPEGKGATLAMKKAMEMAGDRIIDYINAHGTGTANNDHSESTALKLIFGDKVPDYSSTKAYTGHTLGAAGAIEAVFSLLAIRYNWKFPNLNHQNGMKVLHKKPLSKLEKETVNCVLSNSFGFGGNCTSLVFAQ